MCMGIMGDWCVRVFDDYGCEVRDTIGWCRVEAWETDGVGMWVIVIQQKEGSPKESLATWSTSRRFYLTLIGPVDEQVEDYNIGLGLQKMPSN